MTVKKLMMLVLVVALIIVIPAVVLAKNVVRGDATATPPTDIEAKFEFKQNGPKLNITGEATGLSPGKNYHSAVYGFGSSVDGVDACKRADSVGGDMRVGNWSAVTPDGKATLSEVTNADLDLIFTISVRSGLAGGSGSIVLVCGEVKLD